MITSTWHSYVLQPVSSRKFGRREGGGGGGGEDFHSFDVQFPVRNDNRAIEVYIEIFGNLLLGISIPFDFPFLTGISGVFR